MGFEGDMCEREVNECLIQSEDASGPCGNSGVCVDGFNSFSCNCYPDWTGEFCDQMVNYCDSSPCYGTVGKFSRFEKNSRKKPEFIHKGGTFIDFEHLVNYTN